MRSKYLASALADGWEEGETKVVELELADSATVQDLKLLLKLSYGGECHYSVGIFTCRLDSVSLFVCVSVP